MKFRAHDTFFIRKGWLAKGMRNVLAAPDVFVSRENNPMDVLGIGANMVKALRYWMVAVGLTTEPTTGHRVQHTTSLGEIVQANDPYFEETGTLFLLHYQLVKGQEATNTEATAWWYFFNEFKGGEFTRDDFVDGVGKFYLNNSEVSVGAEDIETKQRAFKDDFNCIVNTYVSRQRSNRKKIDPESNIDCPLGELELVGIVGKEKDGSRQVIYRKSMPNKDMLHPLILFAVILDNAGAYNGEQRQIRIAAIQNDNGNAGKAFNLDIISLTALLYKIERLNLIKVNRTAGLDVINILTDWNFEDCVSAYYRAINE
jgi:hypothetical protein